MDAYIGRKFKGLVYQIASSQNGAVTSSTATNSTNDVTNYKVYIRILADSYKDLISAGGKGAFPFRPGMTASADIQTQTKTNVLSVPINAVTTRFKNDELSEKTEKNTTNTNDQSVLCVREEKKKKQRKHFL